MAAVSIKLAERRHLAAIPKIELAGTTLFSEADLPQNIRYKVTPVSDLEDALRENRLWVAEHGDETVGFAAASIVDGCGYVDEIDVMPDYGRQGIGTRLATTVVDWARAAKLPSVALITFRHLAWNGPFYEKLGFKYMDPSEHGGELSGLIEEERRIGINIANRVAMQMVL